ncbi:MAG: glycoside hydrolase family 31 protein [Muribaculaceae bacterium]|nr:glycoside hydrolase family 31 protein [Muribaculaceae bacterium]
MIRKLILCAVSALAGMACFAADNVAYADSAVRFTVITPGVVRMEWSPDGRFVDNNSQLAVNRDYEPVDFKVRKSAGKLTLSTSRLVLTYKLGTGAFARDNLSVVSAKGFFPFSWRPGVVQKGNLKGTMRTLDGLDGDVQTQTWVADMKQGDTRELEDGLLATDGWTLLDDSDSYLFDGDSDWPWVQERRAASGAQDWYFMAYGHDYKSALKDFTVFAGKIPLPPKFTFGYWWSRYWAYSDSELRGLVEKFRSYDIPLDVIVVDMDWHYTDPGRGGWTGWTWNKSLFPDPKGFMDHMHDKGVRVTLNLHPADGFEPYEEAYPRLASRLGLTDSSKIAWVNSDKKMISAAFDEVFRPMEQAGVDFWWLDWQQAINDSVMPGLNNTWWVNYVFFSDMERNRTTRPLLYHRWGGLGNHRYQIGFSGDATISWKSLDYQPYFTSTASNVLYGYWSHDIGGHLPLGGGIAPEMYVRWLQFGAFSPVMRTHSSKSSELNKEPWVFADEYRDVIRRTILQRYAMVPYIYTMARRAHDEGVSLCRPLYYDYPEAPEAYARSRQYMFGDDVLVAPVTTPASDGYASVDVWLPEGQWYELHSGTLLDGGATHTRDFAIDEYGVYVKAASVLPMYPSDVRRADNADGRLVLAVAPGDGLHTMTLYEDAGNDKDYEHACATTRVCHEAAGTSVALTMMPREGAYSGMPSVRDCTVRFLSSAVPQNVSVNGQPADWSYDGDDFAVVVELPSVACDARTEVRLDFGSAEKYMADGIKGRARRVAQAVEYIKFHGHDTHKDELASMGVVREAVAYNPARAAQIVERFDRHYSDLPALLRRDGMPEPVAERFLARIGYKAVRP